MSQGCHCNQLSLYRIATAEDAQYEVDGSKDEESVDGGDEAGDAEAVRVVVYGDLDVGGHTDQHPTDEEVWNAEELELPQYFLVNFVLIFVSTQQ